MPPTRGNGFRRWLIRIGMALVLLMAGTWAAFQLSPWPSVWLIRWAFDRGSAQASAALAAHVPMGIEQQSGLVYDPADPDALLDLFVPASADSSRPLTPIVWIHGGGFVSGRRGDIANYARILAGRGFAVATVDYTLAPTATWPTPTRQVNTALGYLRREAGALGIDASRFVLAGDSAGAQIAAELANAITSSAHAQRLDLKPAIEARQLAGTLLYCGPYDIALVNWDSAFAGFMRTVLWSYLGRRDFQGDPRIDSFSVTRHVTSAFPPSFISVGNGDPLAPHSVALAEALQTRGVRVETVFFPADYAPPLAHEYQFNLDSEAGRKALESSVRFLDSLHE